MGFKSSGLAKTTYRRKRFWIGSLLYFCATMAWVLGALCAAWSCARSFFNPSLDLKSTFHG